MIEIKKEELLKNTGDYEDYSENVCNLSFEELKELGLIKCSGCCSNKNKSSKCSCNCNKKNI